ncbi:hypothetical protein [Crocosphaera sp. Alani8]|uniref:hypothetical protein n=1 Tax=Crocosphaera sp. Alani8 TaxID=3038952 RepID=UPI00313A8465
MMEPGAILQANQLPGDDTISLDTDVRMTGVMKRLIDSNITIQGNGNSISGDANGNGTADEEDVRPLFILSGTVDISDVTITNSVAKGGNGGGGGAGMGGGLFIYEGDVSLNNVNFNENRAIGGNGGEFAGGGLFGDGNLGGGGLFGDGGDGGYVRVDFSNGRYGYYSGNGGYGGYGNYMGGGGFGYVGTGNGTTAGDFGGGGGTTGGGLAGGGSAGNGGFGGGGGAALDAYGARGGNGGFGGGGGNAVADGFRLFGYAADGGDGGYGGGGGAATGDPGFYGYFSNGYYSGGAGRGGFGGGDGMGGYSRGNGGGGAGMGGAIFVRSGIVDLNNVDFTNNSATGGTGANAGQGLGGAIFVMQSTTNSNGNNQGMPTTLATVTASGISFRGNSAADDAGTATNNDDLFGSIGSLDIGLYDANSDTLITPLGNNDKILASTLADTEVTIAAIVAENSLLFGQAESMFINLNNGDVTRTENVEPYALFGDDNQNYFGGILPAGENTISFDVYSHNNLQGDLLGTVTRSFTIIDNLAGELKIGLYDADSDTLITYLEGNDEILASTLANREVTIAAEIPEESILFGQAESMFLDLNNGDVTHTENVEPYALFGDDNQNYFGGILPAGENTISFDVYSQNNLQGDLLGTATLDFEIVNDLGV